MNEGVYRSPKWMKKFFDFELNTGKDADADEKARKKNEIERLRQEEENKRKLKEYQENKKRQEKEQEERETERINAEITELYNRIKIDWDNYPFRDKYSYDEGNKKFTYRIENGYSVVLTLGNGVLTIGYETDKIKGTYTIRRVGYINSFVELINHIFASDKKNRGSEYDRKTSSRYKEKAKSSDPKRNLYDTLVQTASLRREQISKIKDSTEKERLQNELNNLESKIKDMKIKYKFEHLNSWSNYQNISELVTDTKNNLKCEICGADMYETDKGNKIGIYHCSSDDARFWDFDRGSKDQIKSKKHWDDSKKIKKSSN